VAMFGDDTGQFRRHVSGIPPTSRNRHFSL
jgi:hypothetical protein